MALRNKRLFLVAFGWKTQLGLICLAGLAMAFGVMAVARAFSVEPKAYFSGHVDVSASPPVEGPGIEFQVQTIKPNESGENYFVNYRLKREQFRQESKEMLSQLLNSTVEKSKAQAQEQWLALSSKIQSEDEIENLLKIKGFQDCVADVFPDSVTVIVYGRALTPNDVGLIQDVVVRVTDVRLDKIVVMTKQ